MGHSQKLIKEWTKVNRKIGSFGTSQKSLDEGTSQTREEISSKNQITQETDSFLNEEIRKDVSRTYQELPFFQNAAVLKLLTEVLFVWCKINPEVSYKQGMNELLASIVWVYFHEAAAASFGPTNEYHNINIGYSVNTRL